MRAEFVIHGISRTRDRIQKHLAGEMAREGIEDLVPAHGGVLYALSANPGMTLGDLAQALDRSNSTVTALLDKMEHLGYVKRIQSSEDERVFTAVLTARGKSAAQAVQRASKTTLQLLYKGIGAAAKEQFLSTLEQIHSNFE
ncbi:MAG: MarR family transcriptional regulator [Spirochaetia bacterium]|nr:MarR family transcriptional regulator [Spirochaetia bacterium]